MRDRGKIVERKRVAIERNHVSTTKVTKDAKMTRKTIVMVYEFVVFVIFVRFVVE